jgi:hypothetical protein
LRLERVILVEPTLASRISQPLHLISPEAFHDFIAAQLIGAFSLLGSARRKHARQSHTPPAVFGSARHLACIDAGMGTWVVKRFWTKEDLRCVLFQEGSDLELRLYARGRLVALSPCGSVQKAVELATIWYDDAPSDWPPYQWN